MSAHKHTPIESTARRESSGGSPSRCALSARGKPCPTRTEHVVYRCQCGAVGVRCLQAKRMHWTEKP
jgi:hypothetical protein